MNTFKDKTLLITGGTGSFGNAVLKKFLSSDLNEIRIFSRDEKKQDDMRKKYNNSKIKFYIGDVRDYNSIYDAMAVSYTHLPLVSIIIPTRNMKEYLKRCIDSVVEKTDYKNYEIIIVNNQSDDLETLNYFKEISSKKIRIIDYDDEFNYSAINNFAVQQANGKHVLLLSLIHI